VSEGLWLVHMNRIAQGDVFTHTRTSPLGAANKSKIRAYALIVVVQEQRNVFVFAYIPRVQRLATHVRFKTRIRNMFYNTF